jgi:hypothetical protein
MVRHLRAQDGRLRTVDTPAEHSATTR